jgi:hypothetical protein
MAVTRLDRVIDPAIHALRTRHNPKRASHPKPPPPVMPAQAGIHDFLATFSFFALFSPL